MARRKTVIHVDQHVIRANRKSGRRDPPIAVKTYKTNARARRVELKDDAGRVLATLRYEPDKPLSCGAHVWLETRLNVEIA